MRLTAKTLAVWRAATLRAQDGKCALCGLPIVGKDVAVADHDHASGRCRAVLHRSCNAMLGKVENNYKRMGLSNTTQLALMLRGTVPYLLARRPDDMPFYPTYRTEDEKREARNKKARATRAAKKASTA